MTSQFELAVLVAILGGVAVYLCLSRRFLQILFGFLLISNAANLVVLGMSGDPSGRRTAIIDASATRLPVDPLPQALILTAIVIGFSVSAYLTVLLYRIYVDGETATMNGLDAAEAQAEGEGRS